MHIWTGGQNPESPTKTPPAYVATAGAGKSCGPSRAGARRTAQRRRQVERSQASHAGGSLSQPAFGDMFSNLTASYDPIFWPIHVNIDRIWWEWQKRNPTGLPADLDSVLSPWSYTIRDMLNIARFGYEYVAALFFIPVGMEAPIGRFVSKPIKIDRKGQGLHERRRSACTGCRS